MRCTWSNAADPGTRIVALEPAANAKAEEWAVCPQHEPLLRAFVARAERQKTRFFIAVFISMASALAPLFIESALGIAIPLLLIGITLLAFPFAAPLSVARNGVAGSVRLVRIFGALLLAFGALFAGLGLFGA
jgi:hypothetical protein